MRKLYITAFSIALVLTYFSSTPRAVSKYHIQEENQNAFNISFPILTQVHRETIEAFLTAINNTDANATLQDVIDTLKIDAVYNKDLEGSENALIAGLGASKGCIIIKYDNSEASGTGIAKNFTLFYTEDEVTASDSPVVQGVFKTTFIYNEATGIYQVNQTLEGSAPYRAANANWPTSYDTNLWALKLEQGKDYNVDLNFVKDGDISSTGGAGSHWYTYSEYDAYGYSFCYFIPSESGEYQFNVDQSCTIKYGAVTSLDSQYSYSEISSGSSINLYKDRTYYFAIQMPTNPNKAELYPVTVSIIKK